MGIFLPAMRNLLLLSLLTVVACSPYYLDQPQPVDGTDLDRIPRKFRGEWLIQRDGESLDSVSIGRHGYQRVTVNPVRVAMTEVEQDSDVYFIGDRIYRKEGESLTLGHPWYADGDSLEILERSEDIVDLGPKARLRRIPGGYLLNLRHPELNTWWEVRYIDNRDPSVLVVRGLDTKDLPMISGATVLHEDLNHYLHVGWTTPQVEDFIRSGGFSDTLMLLRYADRHPH